MYSIIQLSELRYQGEGEMPPRFKTSVKWNQTQAPLIESVAFYHAPLSQC